jgi:hypothetical protein
VAVSNYKWNTQRAIDFTRKAALFELAAHERGYFIVRGWGKRDEHVQIRIYGFDRDTYHKSGNAQDYTLFILIDGKLEWIEDGEHEAWQELADMAERLGLGTGRSWNDINHMELP